MDRRDPDAEACERRRLALLQAEVEALDEAQLVELSTPSADQIARIADPWIQDLLAAKKYLCRFITRRSPAVQAGEARLTAVLDGEPRAAAGRGARGGELAMKRSCAVVSRAPPS